MALERGDPAPDFRLPALDGRSYSLGEALQKGPVLLVFFKTGCPACDLAFPYLVRLAELYGGRGLQTLAVSQHPAAKSGPYAERFRLPFPVLLDAEGFQASRQYDPPATPTLVLVGQDGRVLYHSHGFSKDDLNELAGLVAREVGVEPALVAPADDGRPPFRPG
jgi:peroxiredoxin